MFILRTRRPLTFKQADRLALLYNDQMTWEKMYNGIAFTSKERAEAELARIVGLVGGSKWEIVEEANPTDRRLFTIVRSDVVFDYLPVEVRKA